MRSARFGVLLVSLVVFSLTCAPAVSALQGEVHWAAGGRATYDAGGKYLGQGVYVRSRMYARPVLNDDWVNSAYAWKDDGDVLEAGWYWMPGATHRRWFVVRKSYGRVEPEFGLDDVPIFGIDSWIGLHVRRNSPTNQYYDVYINGTKYGSYLTTMTSSRAVVGSERYDISDQNKGAWRYVQVMRLNSNGTFEWVYWPHAERMPTYELIGDDPIYDFWWNYVDRSDHYVYCDDHQN